MFDTDVGEAVGTFTVSDSMLNEDPPATACDDEQLTELVPVPVHVHPVPL